MNQYDLMLTLIINSAKPKTVDSYLQPSIRLLHVSIKGFKFKGAISGGEIVDPCTAAHEASGDS